MNSKSGFRYEVGNRVRHIATGEMGTVTQLNPNRQRSVSGQIHDIFVTWDSRGVQFGASFSEIQPSNVIYHT